LLAVLLFGVGVIVIILPLAAVEAGRQAYDVPAGDAELTLRMFAQQSGVQILYPSNEVSGVRTNAIMGEFTTREALEALLAGTEFTAETDERTGGITVKRKQAQRQQEASDLTGHIRQNWQEGDMRRQEDFVRMSAFEVTTTQGTGYTSTNSANAFKTNQSLMDIPQADVVVTNDMIRDLGYENTTDVLWYFGVSTEIEGDVMTIRGNSVQSQPYMDELPTHSYYTDDVIVDSIELVKGPAQSLYISAGASGLVMKSTKRPLPYDQDILTASIDQNGLYRITGDFTGPIGKLGEAELGYRFVGAYQRGNQWFTNGKDDRTTLFPEFQVKYHGMKVRMYYDYDDSKNQTGTGFILPNGNLYTGSGWKNADNRAPGYAADWQAKSVYGEALQKISDNWEMRISGSFWHQMSYGPYWHPLAVNFDNQTETWTQQLQDQRWIYWTALADCQGHYTLGPANWEMDNRDSFGYNFSSWVYHRPGHSARGMARPVVVSSRPGPPWRT